MKVIEEAEEFLLKGIDILDGYTDTERAKGIIRGLLTEIERLTKPADGTWIQKADAMGHEYSMCSACETVINTPDGCGGYYKLDMTGAKYCPNCGAKMD